MMTNLKKIAAGITTAATLSYGVAASAAIPAPGAVADALLSVYNFTLFAGNGAAGKSFTGLPIGTDVFITGVDNSGDVSASLNGASSADTFNGGGIADPFSLEVTQGGAGFTAGSILPFGTINAGTSYAGSHSSTQGNALTGITGGPSLCDGSGHFVGDCVLTHNQINIDGSGVGSAESNNSLLSTFIVDVQGDQLFEMSFNADLFLRAALGQPGISAEASSNWQAIVVDVATGDTILSWEPNGELGLFAFEGDCVAAATCIEYSDTNVLGSGRSTTGANDFVRSFPGGTFEIELALSTGQYEFQIIHETRADATVIVPEPGTLALMGLGILGAGVARRRVK